MSKRVLLIGNPNVGKSTIFNEITGSHQHTGNWTGKTVELSKGEFYYKFINYQLVDLPGTYSLLSSSKEEQIARDEICFSHYDCAVCVIDATNLERNLILALQVLEITSKVIILVNLCDEAKKKNITINFSDLSKILGVPVIKATARSGKGINQLLEKIHQISTLNDVSTSATVFYSNTVEASANSLKRYLRSEIFTDKSLRFFALRLLENNESFNKAFTNYFGNELLSKGKIRGKLNSTINQLNTYGINITQEITLTISHKAEKIAKAVQIQLPSRKEQIEAMLDKILLGKFSSIPVMLILFGAVLWLTIIGSNYPSAFLRDVFSSLEATLTNWLISINTPQIIIDLFIGSILRVLLWVVAVMLPPMAIFFPLFALLEDFGILPRIAFNLDGAFEKCGACGKQALTTCMGYGCNAVGITGARIIDSPRERLIAIITNSLTPCNGRFPLLIAIISMFFCSSSYQATIILLGFIIMSMLITFVCSKLLSLTVLKGEQSVFILELPPYRKPKLINLLKDTIREKIIFVLFRAVVVAAPAGFIIWLMSTISIGDISLLNATANLLNPIGKLIGLDGVMVLAFILGFPANEIVIPIALMAYLSTNQLTDYSNLSDLKTILIDNGWTVSTAICTCIFSMFHFPCSTALLTIWKETKNIKWTIISVLTPLLCGIIICAIISAIF